MTESNNPHADEVNPYSATTLEATSDPVSLQGAEGIRRAHISHEASIKSVGTLYILGGLVLLVGGGGILSSALANSASYRELLVGGMYLAVAAAQGVTGFGLWRLQTWARWIAVVFSILGLIAVPIGTLISAYILYLLLSQKGGMVFSEPYQQVIAQTPHVKYKTSIVVWIVLLIFLVLMALAVGWAFLG